MSRPAETNSVAGTRDAWNFYVFRKSREPLPFADLAEGLRTELKLRRYDQSSSLDALARAGEIETGLTDTASSDAGLAAKLTDQLAAAVLGLPYREDSDPLQLLARIAGPASILCSHPEGFSYYGLNPLDFADLIQNTRGEIAPRAAIVGIRSVGSTLGAIVAAAVRRAGKTASRITVRPEGEPYRRSAAFTAQQLAWLRTELEAGAQFLVVDEGPGFSGSTFLAVAGALERAGVPAGRIVLLCSRPFNPRTDHDRSAEAAGWKRFQSYVISYGRNVPAEAGHCLGGGRWRELLYADRSQWPASWHELERIKHLSLDGQCFIKFEGLGRFGTQARSQATQLGEAGFSPRLRDFENGYATYEFLRGRPLRSDELDPELVRRMAAYCAFRAAHFPAASSNSDFIRSMVRENLRLEFGIDYSVAEVPAATLVYPDSRMLPHEWIKTESGKALKTDAAGHGDAHLLPGPVDIAWDLAGVIVEWEMGAEETALLLREYQRQSGDDAAPRISQYVLFYSIFRMAFMGMAATSLAGTDEGERLASGYRESSEKVSRLLHCQLSNASNKYRESSNSANSTGFHQSSTPA